jgi:hypothetical protein
MPIVAADIKFYLSGGAANSDPLLSLGGAISSTVASTDIFDNVSSTEAATGESEYRCIYAKNTHASLSLTNAVVWIQTQTPSSSTSVTIALGGEGKNGTAEGPKANEETAPTGETFTAPDSKGTGLSLGTLAAGDYYPIWIKRTIDAGAAAYSNDGFTLRVEGDTAA